MNEFSAQTGGRYTYVDDFINLQDLALAFVNIFDECENFIVSGCEVSGSTVSPGYVYINKRIRYFNGATNATFPCYIYEQNNAETLTYANGQDKVGRKIYGCALGASVPSGDDPLTNVARQYILLDERGNGLRMDEAFFGTNCMLLNSNGQTVQGNVTFANNVTIVGSLNLDSIMLTSGNFIGRIYFEADGKFVVQNRKGDVAYGMTIAHGNGFVFSAAGQTLLTIGTSQVSASVPLSVPRMNTSNVTIASNNVYEHATNADNGALKINMLGYNGASSRYRDTVIGNGRGAAILTVDGSASMVQIDGTIVANSSDKEAFVLKSTYPRSSEENFLKTLVIEDSSNYVAAVFGYNSATDGTHSNAVHDGKVLSIINNIGSIDITGTGCVNIGPVIYENGVALSTKYIQRSELPSWVFGDAPSSGLTQEIADGRYARLTNGLSQFVRGTNTAQVLCNQIGAMNMTTADGRYAKLSSYLADMARTEAEKALIRANLGIPSISQQTTIYDSGWKDCRPPSGITWARQWGKVVSVEGHTFGNSVGNTVFTIPTGIAPPKYDIELIAGETYRSDTATLCRIRITAGQRNAIIAQCPDTLINAMLTITLTYMVS